MIGGDNFYNRSQNIGMVKEKQWLQRLSCLCCQLDSEYFQYPLCNKKGVWTQASLEKMSTTVFSGSSS